MPAVIDAKLKGQVWLAKQLGVSQPRVSKLVKAGRIPRKTEYGDGDVATIREHLIEARASANATTWTAEVGDGPVPDALEVKDENDSEKAIRAFSKSPERVARIKLIIERTAKIKLERELLAGGYVQKSDVEKEQVARVYSVRAKLQELPLRASLICQKSEMECEGILNEWAKEICTYYANGGN